MRFLRYRARMRAGDASVPEDAELAVTRAAESLLGSSLDMATTLRSVVGSARDALGAAEATCYSVSEDLRVSAVHTTEVDPGRRALLESALGRAPEEIPLWRLLTTIGEPVLAVEDVASGSPPALRPALARALGARAVIGARLEHPLLLEPGGAPTVLGSLFCGYPQPRAFTLHDRAIARGLANLAALALANARLHAQTLGSLALAERRAATDPLTGLANYRTFQERLGAEAERAGRHARDLALVVLDLDAFKAVNDHHGHPAGDRVLVEAARRLSAETRPSDLLARVGGEEFAWLLPETGGEAAWTAAERARVAIGREPFGGVGRITISAGVCDLLDASGPAAMYARADGALLWAKSHGRDVVVRWSADLGAPSAVEPEPPAEGAAPQGRRIAARVADLALVLAGSAGWPADEAALLYEAALVHQMGRLRLGTAVGAGPGGAGPGASAISAEQAAWIRSRRERWDGGGGPDGLRGEEIPLGARLLAIADAFEEMIRPPDGGAGLAVREALATCRRGNGERFAPDAVAALERAWAEGRLRA